MKRRPIRTVFESLESRKLLSSTLPGLTGEYFAGDEFQTPMVVRTDSTINFNWPNGRPDESMTRNSVFTARWTGQIDPAVTGTYTFYTKANSGTQVLVGGTVLFDNLASTTSSVQQQTVALTAGTQYPIQVEYVSHAKGDAHMQLLWSADGIKKQVVPKSVLTPDTTVALPTEALLGTYYLGSNFQTPVMTRSDSKISFDWETGTPDQAIPHDTAFSVRWTGNITAAVSGNYRFRTITDDGVRLFVNGVEIINDWNIHSAQSDVGKIALTAGQTYTVRMDYFQDGSGHDSARLLWKQPGGGAETLVPFNAPITVVPPTVPLNVTATPVSTSQINVSWSDVANETGFEIRRSADGITYTQVGTTAQGVTTFDDTGLIASTIYDYEVIAENAGGESPISTAVQATTLGLQPPAVVANATALGNTATITWTSAATATSYLVERSPDGSNNWTSVGTTANTTLTDSTLASGTIYFYRVTPSNTAGAGPTSNVVSVTTVPAAPTSLAATVASPSQINLTWNDVTGETGFIVQESANGTNGWSQIGTTATGVTNFAVGGLAASTQYFFRVIAIDSSGNSAPSNVANATTSAALPAYASLSALYGMSNGDVYSIDPTNGNATQIGSLSFATQASGRDPVSGDFYYVSTGSPNVQIASWDPTTGTNHLINNSVPVGSDVDLAAFRDDGIFFLGDDVGQLYAVNSTSGAATLKGSLQVNGSPLALHTGDMAFSPDGTLYIETGSELYSVTRFNLNAANGGSSLITATDLGPTGTANLQVAFGQNGLLFGTNAAGQLFTLNLTNGAATQVGNGNGVAMNDLASAPIYADLSVTQTASSLVRGSNAAFTLTVSNAGPQPTNGPITLIDILPTGLTFVSGTGTGWTFSQSGQTVTMTYTGAVAAAASAPAVTLTAAVGTGAASTVSNAISTMTTVFDTNTGNNSSTLNSAVTG